MSYVFSKLILGVYATEPKTLYKAKLDGLSIPILLSYSIGSGGVSPALSVDLSFLGADVNCS